MSPSLDHVGPMARRVADAAIMFDAISGPDPQDPTSLSEPPSNVLGQIDQGIKNLRIGLDRTYALEGIDRGQAAALENAVKGVVVEPAPSPPFKVSQPQFSLEFLIIALEIQRCLAIRTNSVREISAGRTHRHTTVLLLTDLPAILPRHSHRMASLLGKSTITAGGTFCPRRSDSASRLLARPVGTA